MSCSVNGATGTHDLYLKFTGGGGNLFNVNWWQFNAAASTGNLLTNGDLESGTTGWGVFGSGTLSRAALYIETAAGTDSPYIDDASFR